MTTPLLSSNISNCEDEVSILSPTMTSTSNPRQIIQIINNQEVKNFKIGIILLIISITTWIVGLELVNTILKSDGYHKPWLFATITGSCFVINFLPDVLYLLSLLFNKIVLRIEKENEESSVDQVQENKIFSFKVFSLAFQISIIYYCYNIFVMEALQFTSASNQTVIGSLTSVFTLIIGVVLKSEKFSYQKLICVLCSCLGVYLVNFSDSSANSDDPNGNKNKFVPKNPRLGNTLALCGALFYAFYLLIMKIKGGSSDYEKVNKRRLFGLVGLITMIIGVPVLYVADLYGIEKFQLPPSSNKKIIIGILINGVFSVISDYTSIIAMLLTSPLIVSLTLTSSIPLTIFIDYMVLIFTNERIETSFTYVFGIICILVAILLININITSENELIHDIIEESIEEAIKNDDFISPILSPLLDSQIPTTNIKSPLMHILKPKSKKMPNLDLSENSYLRYNQSVYNARTTSTYEGNHIDDNTQDFVVISGGNHKYVIKRNAE